MAESAKLISACRATKLVERLDAELLRAQPAAGTGGIVRLAAPLRAIGEDRLQRRAVETRDRQLGQAQVDRLLVAGVHDRRHGQPVPASRGSPASMTMFELTPSSLRPHGRVRPNGSDLRRPAGSVQ